MASKRHVVEEGNTPGKPANKRQSENANTGSRKTLFPGEAKPPALSCSTHMEWSDNGVCMFNTGYMPVLGRSSYRQVAHDEKYKILELLC